ncbi:ABC transporter ATP-binding protein [Bartonella sp. HY329]|uniref:ABC transporter ATP-binding protein n=1 Tax=unclassified Bartonella TaxID=2645622 RepID=UPI0021C999A1|nr:MULTISPECIES: ABC transporter ATP-binding protein [unclassified Bartonella]UXM95156.1 ABC transporter ATP-binding protein [Bartonella sp. HY329]UXN09479.1 ABC transporter ATP-binding protein [Bartonella sp. HY328]
MTPMLSVRDLSVAFRQDGQEKLSVKNVSFDIMPGETVALVGESGSGKSVTALSVLKLLPYPMASHPSGEMLFRQDDMDKDLMKLSEKQLQRVRGKDISMIFQEPMTSLNPLHRVEQQIGEILRIHQGMSVNAARARVVELLEQVGIKNAASRLRSYPHELSGGQRQRVMIAMALANNPRLLIADEPTTALDVTVQAQILDLLADLKKQHKMSMLFITHDLGIVRKIADRVAVMTKGEIVEMASVEEIFANPQHDYTKKLLAAEPKGNPPAVDPNAPIIMRGEKVRVWFPIKTGLFRKTTDYIKAVNDIDINIKAGQTIGVVGESGSGKTTLGLALTRMISSKGIIQFDGKNINKLSYKKMRPLRRDIQIVFQDPFGSLSPRMSVGEIIAEGLSIHQPKLTYDEREDKVIAAMEEVRLDPQTRHRYPHEFSGGQRQRISIARAMVLNPRFVMLDEPTSALDMSVQAEVVDLLRELQQKHNLSYLFISHDLKVVKALANEVLVMRDGKVVERGAAKDIFANPREDYTKTLMAAAFNMNTRADNEIVTPKL